MRRSIFFTVCFSLLFEGTMAEQSEINNALAKATFAGGCFWCMEPSFEKLQGVQDVISGYTAGTGENPTYQDYAQKGHIEAIQITYDPQIISFKKLLDVFWRQIDPTDAEGQFVDRGPQYRSAIFYHNEQQKNDAQTSKNQLIASGRFDKPIVTEITEASTFYPAEAYHQDYAQNHPWRYWWYRSGSGRDTFLNEAWKQNNPQTKTAQGQYTKPSEQELRKRLTPLQYKVTQQEGTEPPFDNPYWHKKDPGIYVDIVSGEPLFSSLDKFKSGSGWPAFTKPLESENIVTKEDRRLFMTRTEVRSKLADSHLGHVFKLDSSPTGLHYCINSAALRFIPVQDLQKEGYSTYKSLFEQE